MDYQHESRPTKSSKAVYTFMLRCYLCNLNKSREKDFSAFERFNYNSIFENHHQEPYCLDCANDFLRNDRVWDYNGWRGAYHCGHCWNELTKNDFRQDEVVKMQNGGVGKCHVCFIREIEGHDMKNERLDDRCRSCCMRYDMSKVKDQPENEDCGRCWINNGVRKNVIYYTFDYGLKRYVLSDKVVHWNHDALKPNIMYSFH